MAADSDAQILFAWLHLSDIHANHGTAEHRHDQVLILESLLRDVPRAIAHGAPSPDAIVVTGDIAFSGDSITRPGASEPGEYARASTWLRQIAQKVRLDEDAIWMVPGNHDVARSRDGEALSVIESLRADPSELDAALDDPSRRELLEGRLRRYLALCRQLNPAAAHLSSWHHEVSARRGLRVRLVGLNTALLSNDDRDRGRLTVGKRQLRDLMPQAEDELVIALTHHPLSGGWLADEAVVDSFVRRHAHVHLCGHTHASVSKMEEVGGKGPLISVVAGAVHEEKSSGPPSHGYNLAAVVAAPDGALSLRVWPRTWSSGSAGFTVDRHAVRDPLQYETHGLELRVAPLFGGAHEVVRSSSASTSEPAETDQRVSQTSESLANATVGSASRPSGIADSTGEVVRSSPRPSTSSDALGTIAQTIECGSLTVHTLAWDARGQHLGVGGTEPRRWGPAHQTDSAIAVWDLEAGAWVSNLVHRAVRVCRALWMERDGSDLVFGGPGGTIGAEDGIIERWDPASGQQCSVLKMELADVEQLAVAPDGQVLARGQRRCASGIGQESFIVRIDPSTGSVKPPVEDERLRGFSMTMSRDGRFLLGGSGPRLVLWDLAAGRDTERSLEFDWSPPVALDAPGRFIALSHDAGPGPDPYWVMVVDRMTGSLRTALRVERKPTQLAFSPQGDRLAINARYGMVQLWDPTLDQPLGHVGVERTGAITRALAFDPQGRRIAWANDAAIEVFELR